MNTAAVSSSVVSPPLAALLPRRRWMQALAGALLACVSGSLAHAASGEPARVPTAAELAGRQVVLITGSTDGLGREVAKRVGATGAHVIIHGRNRERGMQVVQEINEEGKGSARFYGADLASFAKVRELGEAILRDYPRLNVLVNNAGIWLQGNQHRLSEDGQEMHFAVNYLSGFLLTHMLLPRLIESAPARIVNVSSGSQRPIDFDDLKLEQNYSDSRGYAVSKLAQILFTFDLAEDLKGTGVTANVLHPASMMNTPMVLSRNATPRATVEEGTEAVLNLITSPNVQSGQYFNGLNPARANAQAYDEEARRKLREVSRELTGAPNHLARTRQ